MKIYKFILLMTLTLLVLIKGAHADAPPFFIPALVNKSSPHQVRTLSTFELTNSLNLHSEISEKNFLDDQMQLQFEKLKTLMPMRAKHMALQWTILRSRINQIQTDLVVPPGIKWDEWAKPADEDIEPVAVSSLAFDGSWITYLNKDLFPQMPASEQAQVLWQMLWAYELNSTDNLQVRLISNYLFSSEWHELTVQSLFDILKRLNFNSFEDNGFYFLINERPDFYSNGHVKSGVACDECSVTYYGQNIFAKGVLSFSESGNLEFSFNVSSKTPWHFKWHNEDFFFETVELYQDGSLKSGFTGLDDSACINLKPLLLKILYAEITMTCSRGISFYANGVIDQILQAKALVTLQNQKINVAGYQSSLSDGDLQFFENGSIKNGYFPKGANLKNIHNVTIRLNKITFIELNKDGLVQ